MPRRLHRRSSFPRCPRLRLPIITLGNPETRTHLHTPCSPAWASTMSDPPPTGFAYSAAGRLLCDGHAVADLLAHVDTHYVDTPRSTPFYLYSMPQVDVNVAAWQAALSRLPGRSATATATAAAATSSDFVGFAVKANSNMLLLRFIASKGCGCVLVSGNELELALLAGFPPEKCILNGNGKLPHELERAVRAGVMVNVDSEFDLRNIQAAAARVGARVNVLLRINPDVDPRVHPYVATGNKQSKFGIDTARLEWFLDEIEASGSLLCLVGVHCHLGSTISDVSVFRDR